MRKRISLPFFVLLCGLTVRDAKSETYAERLGWSPEDRVLIIHSDDVGMSHASNMGTIAALEFGLVTSVSVMMPCAWVGEFAAYIKQHPGIDMGLHLTLTSEWDDYRWGPVAGKSSVPGLADEQGCLWDNVPLVLEHATPEEIEREIRAQIDRAETMGLEITHLDSHMGTLFSSRDYFERFVSVGIEKQIPILIVDPAGRENPDSQRSLLMAEFIERIWDAGLPAIDFLHTASYGWKTTQKIPFYVDAIRSLKPGITEMIIHCTKPDEVIDVITNGREHLYGDYYAMISSDVSQVLKEEGIILTTWRELKERRQRLGQ